jgi:glyoxylase-like metal-dependent hydrolase (beta-lactamase superfamily II)
LETPAVLIERISVSEQDNNVYALTSRADGGQLLIDAADEADRIIELLGEGGGHLATVVTTHSHWDHVRALAEVVRRTGARSLAGPDAAQIAADCGVPTGELADGDIVGVGSLSLKVVTLVGHTPGSIALVYEEAGQPAQLFTGDSLFPGGVGNTWRDPARFASLFGDVVAKIFQVYDDDAVVWPGHGRPTTLGAERGSLGEWERRGW